MARPAKPENEKNVQVSAAIKPEAYAALQELRWQTRAEKLSTVVSAAIDEYIANHGKVGAEAPESK